MNKKARVIAAVLAVVLGVSMAACGGKKPAANAGKTSDATSSTSTTAAADAAAVGGSSTTGAQSTGKSGATTTAKGSGAAGATTTVAGGSSSGGASGSGASSAAPVGAKPGSYTYDTTGSRSGGTPPTTAPVNSKTTSVFDPSSGTTQHSAQSDGSGQGGGQELVLEYRADGVYIQNLKFSGQLNKEFKPNPPVLASPIPVTAGKQWTWDMTSTDGSTTIHADNKATGTEAVTVGGQSVDCDKLDIVLTIKTTVNGAPITVTITSTRWQSAKYSMTIKTHDVTDVPGFGHSDTTSVLESVNPA